MNESTKNNLNRKSKFIDNVQLHKGLPLFSWIEISLTELCNRKCVFCPRVDDKYPNQNLHMSIDTIANIADELRELQFKGAVALCGYGEPMLHNDIYTVVKELHDIDVEIVTNGDKLNVDVMQKLYTSGLKHLQISMYDGPDQINKFINMINDAGIDKQTVSLRDRWYDETVDYGLCLTNRAGTIEKGPKVNKQKPCNYLAYSLMIDWNGDILLCSQDWHKKRKFGNLASTTMLDAWMSRDMMKYRNMLISGNRSKHPCSGCNVLGTRIGNNHARLWKKIM